MPLPLTLVQTVSDCEVHGGFSRLSRCQNLPFYSPYIAALTKRDADVSCRSISTLTCQMTPGNDYPPASPAFGWIDPASNFLPALFPEIAVRTTAMQHLKAWMSDRDLVQTYAAKPLTVSARLIAVRFSTLNAPKALHSQVPKAIPPKHDPQSFPPP